MSIMSILAGGGGLSVPLAFTASILTSQTNLNLRTWALENGWDGVKAATITINSGIYVYSTAIATPGLTINGTWPGGITLVNNGFIMGMGGNAGTYYGTSGVPIGPQSGGNAISLGINTSIQNNSYIGGGGGGGQYGDGMGGGGGAGGGIGGRVSSTIFGGAGGAIGSAGGNGSPAAGGGGGRIMPGVGGAGGTPAVQGGRGGGAGGGGGEFAYYGQSGGAGGSAGNAGVGTVNAAAAGGGGWGASGGSTVFGAAGIGGKAVALNGYAVTWLANGTRYGAIS